MPETPFSKRHGYKQPKEITVWEDAPERVRSAAIANAVSAIGQQRLREIICDVLKTHPETKQDARHQSEHLISSCEWFHVYDAIEALYAEMAFGGPLGTAYSGLYEQAMNHCFEEEGIGWQLVSGEIITRGAEAFEAALNTAASELSQRGLRTAAKHTNEARQALSRRPEPDTSGAVSHATSAVECVLGDITGTPMTLGRYLDQYPGLFHPALKKGLDGLYGYASDAGARHGKEGIEPAREEAEFVVTVCAAVCTLLTRKQS